MSKKFKRFPITHIVLIVLVCSFLLSIILIDLTQDIIDKFIKKLTTVEYKYGDYGYPNVYYKCKTGDKKETINREAGFKATFTCINNPLKFSHSYIYRMPDGKALFFDPYNYQNSWLFDPETHQYIKVDRKIIVEKNSIYGINRLLNKNEILVYGNANLIIYNYKTNTFHKVPKNDSKKYYKSKQKFDKLFPDIYSLTNLNYQNNIVIANKHTKKVENKIYDFIFIKDSLLLKYSKPGKLIFPLGSSAKAIYKDQDEIYVLQGKNIQLYNPLTGTVSAFYKFSTDNSDSQLYVYKDKLIIYSQYNLGILNLKTKAYNSYSITENYNKYYSTVALLSEDHLLFYRFNYPQAILFDLKRKRSYKINNLKMINSVPIECEVKNISNIHKSGFWTTNNHVMLYGGHEYETQASYQCFKENESIVMFTLEKFINEK